jgi:hypothetical protein
MVAELRNKPAAATSRCPFDTFALVNQRLVAHHF